MAQRRFHYEQAFEHYLRSNRVPYVAVDEARKSLVPTNIGRTAPLESLKSFDFVIYGPEGNLLIDVKGRKCRLPKARLRQTPTHGDTHCSRTSSGTPTAATRTAIGTATLLPGRLESWVPLEDVDSLAEWQRLFGDGFKAMFVFAYWCAAQPPDALFQEVFQFRDRWYALRGVELDRYRRCMKTRSAKWKTVHVPTASFAEISEPFSFHRGPEPAASTHVAGVRQEAANPAPNVR